MRMGNQVITCILTCVIYQGLLAISYVVHDPFGDDLLDFPVMAYAEYVANAVESFHEAQDFCPAVASLTRDGQFCPPDLGGEAEGGESAPREGGLSAAEEDPQQQPPLRAPRMNSAAEPQALAELQHMQRELVSGLSDVRQELQLLRQAQEARAQGSGEFGALVETSEEILGQLTLFLREERARRRRRQEDLQKSRQAGGASLNEMQPAALEQVRKLSQDLDGWRREKNHILRDMRSGIEDILETQAAQPRSALFPCSAVSAPAEITVKYM